MAQGTFDRILDGKFVPKTEADWEFLRAAAQNLFKPRTPIDNDRLFSGRIKQIKDLLDVVYEEGGHAIIFGERGVGKTSLANIIEYKVAPVIPNVKCINVSCSPGDSFFTIWTNALDEYTWNDKPVAETLKGETNPYAVYRIIEALDREKYHLIILDEFDRIKNSTTTQMVADMIKHFSNHPINTTIVIVGVGDTLVDLFGEHESIARACAQIQMPRMSRDELADIIDERVPKLNMEISQDVQNRIIQLSQGLPGYVHLLGQLSVRSALDHEERKIGAPHLHDALDDALEKADRSTRLDYYKAVESPAHDHKYKEALLACALAQTNELGMFFAGSVREPYSMIRGRPMGIENFATHLNEFCSADRGPALIKSGKRKRYQYRFSNPLLQPLVVMAGVRDGLIKMDQT